MSGLEVRWTRYGKQAYDELRTAVARAKQSDPLAPVTVLVPTNLVGTAVRRALARTGGGDGADGRRGVAGVNVLTVDRLAELVAAPSLTGDGRRPATAPLLAAAWRTALASDPASFEPVAEHQATVRALTEAHRTLRTLTPAAADAAAATGRLTQDLVVLHRRVAEALVSGWYDTADLHDRAQSRLGADPAHARRLGEVLLFLPQDLTLGATALIRTLAAATGVTVVAGLVGDARADAGVVHTVQQAGADQTAERPQLRPAHAGHVFHASDADDEVRGVVRMVVSALTDVPAHRMAVLYGSAVPYARLLHEHLAAAHITVNGPGVRSTVQQVLPRGLLELLTLADKGLHRTELFRLLAGAPVRDEGGRLLPVSRWERLSRAAGVVGPHDWDARLTWYAGNERAHAEHLRASEGASQGLVARHERNAEAADELRSFTRALHDRLETGRQASDWHALATWALDTFRVHLGDERTYHVLPEEQARAGRRVEQLLAGLAGLDAVEPVADLGTLRQAVETELAEDRPRTGTFGTGVLVAPLAAAIGLDVDRVFVVGLAEDLCPGPQREDALLPDAARGATAGELPLVRDNLDRRHRHLLAALAAAPDVVVSFPRGDLRRSSERLPSRWLLPTLRELTGQPDLAATDWATVRSPDVTGSRSYADTLTSTDVPATGQEWRQRHLTASRASGVPVRQALPEDQVIGRASELLTCRNGPAFTRFDGNLTAHRGALTDPTDPGVVVSPTQLEAWTACPHAYFVQRVLGVEPVEQPEEILQISPLNRGSLIHESLDKFFRSLADTGGAPSPDEPWSDAHRAQLRQIAEQVADDYVKRGVSGHPTLWQRDRELILDDIVQVLDQDTERRHAERLRFGHSEYEFGRDANPPVVVLLADGRSVRMRGSVDRVDRADNGTLVVADYKTGKVGDYKNLTEADPDNNGSKLQLPVYAYAVRQLLGDATSPVRAEYWFVGPRDRGKRIGYALTPAVEARYAKVLTTIADGIAGGVFPANAPEDQPWMTWVVCPYCDPDGLGAKEGRARWERKKQDPALEAYLALVEPGSTAAANGQAAGAPAGGSR